MAEPKTRLRACWLPISFDWWIGGLVLALVAVFAYWPGTRGDFLFDDFANLSALGRYGGVHDVQTFLYYLTSGIADPTGRPVSMLSFLIDATDWPSEPYPFKRTNILLHAINGLLLHAVLIALGRRRSADNIHIRSAAMLATALWMLHPLWASTVLYVVQRQAMLAAFFVLMGIRAWIASRDAFDQSRPGQAWAWAAFAVPACGLLAGLSKANGFLLPLLLLVLHATVLRAPAGESRPAWWSRLLLVTVPAMATIAALASLGWQASGGNTRRSFSFGERLLSQPRALLEYLHQLLIPGLDNTGVFADGFVASTNLLTPWTTLPALLLLVSMVVVGWRLRRSRPIVACALLFYLVGHSLESGPLMLELYFEHRNYLPATFLFWPVAWWLCAPGHYRRYLIGAGLATALLLLLLTCVQANLWSNPLALARDWAVRNPDSARAQTYAAQQEMAQGYVGSAEQRLVDNLARHPDEPQFALNLLNLRCEAGILRRQDLDNAVNAVRREGIGLDMTNQWLASVLTPGSGHVCAHLPDVALAQLVEAATAGRHLSEEEKARMFELSALMALRNHRCREAQRSFANRLEVQPRPEAVQSQTGMLATHCGADLALTHLQQYLGAGAPASPPPSPVLRIRDKMMEQFWAEHWDHLLELLRNESISYSPSEPTRVDA